jgi:hypothetical protein
VHDCISQLSAALPSFVTPPDSGARHRSPIFCQKIARIVEPVFASKVAQILRAKLFGQSLDKFKTVSANPGQPRSKCIDG